jgi:hypothetical protein
MLGNMDTPENSSTCCPEFDPKPWDEKEHIWKDKLFMADKVRQFMHMSPYMS